MSKIGNMLRMIELLQSGRKMKISELADELGVKERMIRSYKDELELANIYIESTKGREGGYYIPNTSFATRNLTTEEFKALEFAVQKLNEQSPVYIKTTQRAMEKLRAVKRSDEEKDRYIYFVHKSKPNYEVLGEERKFDRMQEALQNLCKVKITYVSGSGEESVRLINPYGFVHYNEFFYCVAFCNVKQEQRIFKLARIKDIYVTGEVYTIPEEFDIRKTAPKIGLMNETLQIHLHIAPEFAPFIKESIWGENQKITDLEDGSISFEATMSGTVSVKKWILSMGTDAKIISPVSLREEIIEESRKLLELYSTF